MKEPEGTPYAGKKKRREGGEGFKTVPSGIFTAQVVDAVCRSEAQGTL
jgi:hypothetical protein